MSEQSPELVAGHAIRVLTEMVENTDPGSVNATSMAALQLGLTRVAS
jgi:hypothetical protein